MFPRPLLPLPVHHHATSLSGQAPQRRDADTDVESKPEAEQHAEPAKFVGGDAWTQSQAIMKEAQQQRKGGWTSEMIEDERRRGMEVVNAGDLDDLDDFFCDGGEVLGRHFDI